MASSITIELAKVTSKMELRRLMRRKIAIGSTFSERRVQSYVILHKLLHHRKYKEAKRIAVYLSYDSEVDTIAILADAFTRGKQCFIPYIDEDKPPVPNQVRMLMVELKSMSEYAKMRFNKWGVKELDAEFITNRQIADPTLANLDLAIVPGLAFTNNGKRLGKGKGYYDEFLFDWANKSPIPLYTIGLALNDQIVDDVLAVDGKDFVLSEILSAQ